MSMLLNAFAFAAAFATADVRTATGANSATMPSHSAGDIIFQFGFRDGFTSGMSPPAGWTTISSAGANTCMGILIYKIAASSSEVTGTWTNSTGIIVAVVHAASPALGGNSGITTGNASSVSYSALTMSSTSGHSIVLGFAGHKSVDTTLETPPTGMTNAVSVITGGSVAEMALHKTGSVTAWSLQTVAVGGITAGWATITVEITGAV